MSQTLYIFTLGLHAFSAFIIMIVLFYYIIQYCCFKLSTSNIRFIIKLLTIIGTVACVFCAVSNGLSVYFYKDSHDFSALWSQVQGMTHCINNIMTYSIYIYRLHLSFYDTMFKISKCTFFILFVFMVLDVVEFVVESIVYKLKMQNSTLFYLDYMGLFAETMTTLFCIY